MICFRLRDRFRFLDFLVRMWLLKDFENENFPLPVGRKRFAADRLVFIFGIPFTPFESSVRQIRNRTLAVQPETADKK